MKNIKSKKLFIIMIVLVCILFIGISYAFISFTVSGTKTYSIVGGELKLELDETNNELTIGQTDAIPVADYQGLQQDGYNFTVINDGKADINYYIYVDDNEDKTMVDEAIRYGLTKENEDTVLGEFSELNNRLLTSGIIKTKEEIDYNLKFWIGVNATNEQVVGKTFSVKIRIVGEQIVNLAYQDETGANRPYIASNMIPVTYNSETDSWVKANINHKWYDYSEYMWANAVTVSEENRDTYMKADAGTPISMDDINTMWVWIPRYEYETITSTTATEIKVNFIAGTETNKTDNYITHPAFTFGDKELEGIWVAKFEASSDQSCTATTADVNTGCDVTTLKVQVKPNVTSWRGIRTSTLDLNTRSMNDDNNIYGFKETEVDTHAMKNLEWGAVAYLSQSKYGKYGNPNYEGVNKEIYQNKSSDYLTGRSNGTPSTDVTNTQSSYDIEGSGTGASTTGTIYGIYDMSGGAYEYVMGVIKGNESINPMSGSTDAYNSGFGGQIYNSGNYKDISGRSWPNFRYYDLYEFGTTHNDAAAYARYKSGDATTETKSWNGDHTYFIDATSPWFVRGGGYSNGIDAGTFNFSRTAGRSVANNSFRPVLAQE